MDEVLVLGHRGRLGAALTTAFGTGQPVHGLSRRDGFDAADFDHLRHLLEQRRPRIVANAIAYTGLDACERDPDQAVRLNALLPKLLAECSRELGFLLLHFSTDAVFDGTKGGAYLESDPPAPLNVYGQTKLDGDRWVADLAPEHYVFRLSVLAGPSATPPQFLDRMLALAREGQPLRVASDVVCSPSSVLDVATTIQSVVAARRPYGLYHTANAGQASLWELVDTAVRACGLSTPVQPVSHTAFPGLARKALSTPLASSKLAPLRPWREAIAELYR